MTQTTTRKLFPPCRGILLIGVVVLLSGCAGAPEFGQIGEIHRYAQKFDALVPPDARIEQLTEDVLDWSEGPVWLPARNHLVFSDVPQNTAWKWSERKGLEVFLQPSTRDDGRRRDPRNIGTNGLTLSLDGKLLAADSGSRSVTSIDVETLEKEALVTDFGDKRFNSPNDLVISRHRWPGTLFFTDPPYGLDGQDESPLKELDHNGVYRLDPAGVVTLLEDTLSRPNGIALSPDEKTLYVANSDNTRSVWFAFELDSNGDVVGHPREFANSRADVERGRVGNDGMAVDEDGNVWATGPMGVYVFSPEGEALGLIDTGTAAANCTFGDADGRTLYITSDGFLARVRTNTRGIEFRP